MINCPIQLETVLITRLGKINTVESLVKSNKNNQIEVIIENPTLKQISIRKGSPIGRVSGCEVMNEIRNETDLANFIKDEELEVVNSVCEIESEKYKKTWKPSSKLIFTNKSLTNEQEMNMILEL